MKTLRFHLLLNIHLPITRLFSIIALHTFWTNILPMRAGDVSYVYLLKSREQVSGTKSVASLMVASVLDILVLLVLIVSLAVYFIPSIESTIFYISFIIIPSFGIFMILGVISIALVAPKSCVTIAEQIAFACQRSRFSPLIWIADKFTQVIHELTDISFNLRLFGISAYSIVIVGIRFGMQCYLVSAMGMNLRMLEIVFALAFTAFCNMFPIQSFGGFGAVEAPWTWALTSLGALKSDAITAGFSLHLIIIPYCVVMGLYGFVTLVNRTGKNFPVFRK